METNSSLTEINWNNFKAKFNGKEQKSFEWLCSLLFCSEFNIKTGLFRYKNQAGIESEPIEYEGKLIGFQAKFYETKISENKTDIKDSIAKAKAKNSKLDKILFYINQEFSESSKGNQKEPSYKIDIEDYAKTQNVEIDWRIPSHFEAQLALEKNARIAKHFFSLDKSIIDFINELTLHTESILTPIHCEIKFKGQSIKIDRSSIIGNIKSIVVESPLLILSGKAGVGKTAVIKDLYGSLKEETPFFIFKAIEFNVPNINHLFANYGQFTLLGFIEEHQNIDEKYIVIDSAEKLSDVENQEVFQEFLSALLANKWKIIFATRYSYLDDLKFQFVAVYHISFQALNIDNLTAEDLTAISNKNNFILPNNERLLELLQCPFYLNEYLQSYDKLNNKTSFADFKEIMWNKQISKSAYQKDNIHRRREECFLKIAQKRANDGHLFVQSDIYDNVILQNLEADEIIKYDSKAGGYFIAHDIYEEWALDKIIERSFCNSVKYADFFHEIGSSLPIRRAFRNWLSEKLISNQSEVSSLIDASITDNGIENYWKDEIYISVLLSDYSERFFQLFESKLLENKQNLLMRLIFLLRIACKDIDESFLSLLGIRKTTNIALKTLFTRPKGKGWISVIGLIHKNKDALDSQNINTILPLLDDWNNKNKTGETTKKASQIALFYYDKIAKNGGFGYGFRNDGKEQLIRVILQGASEIIDELKSIFDEIISKKQTGHRDKYYEIVETILTSITDGFEVVKSLPNYVIKLADPFWFHPPEKADRYEYHSIGVEKDFGLSEKHDFDYFPASAFQTPVFQLLRVDPKETVDFILSFTNKSIECYAKSELNDEIEEVNIFVGEAKPIKQYISNRLWNMYRGTQVSTSLLESIHMALEKWFLEYAKSQSKENIEKWCQYLIENSKSSSITAIVTSIVLAQPSKLFNIAKILFKTKEFFLYDAGRMMLDQQQKSHLVAFKNGFPSNYKNEIYENERIESCDDCHRKLSLEDLALRYQLFRLGDESENEVKERQKTIWEILDKYYLNLPDKSLETDSDKIWRLYLARMDRRKMRPTVEKKDEEVLIEFNPEIDPELKKYSEDSLMKSSAPMKYTPLKIWADYRLEGEKDKYQKYQQYESNAQLIISETKEIVERLKNKPEEDFYLFNYSIPSYACSVLIRDFFDKLNDADKAFCQEMIVGFAALPIRAKQYHYQISDGTKAAIIILPEIIKRFPKDKGKVKTLLLLLLLNQWREISTFAIRGILHSLWETNFDDAHAIFLGYLLLKPKCDDLRAQIRKENHEKGIYEHVETQVFEFFEKKYENELIKMVSNKITYDELNNLEKLDLDTLKTAFELLPLGTKNQDHKKFLNVIFSVFSKKLLQDDDKFDYTLKQRFLEKLAYFILTSTKEEIAIYLKPFVDNFSASREMADFFQEFISVEDRLNQYDNFWIVWNAFYPKIVEICKNQRPYYVKEIIHNYLLAWPYWKEEAKEWHTLKEREKLFYKKVAEDIGYHPSVLYSISKILNDIGSNFIEDGTAWISNILQKNNHHISGELEINTLYYIENIIRRYVFINRQKIKTTLPLKTQIIVVLNFLVERGSITGYLLRDHVL
jgi:hypothetical protein